MTTSSKNLQDRKTLRVLRKSGIVAIIVFTGWLIYSAQNVEEFDAIKPKAVPIESRPLPAQLSSLTVPISIPIEEVETAFNRAVKKTESGSETLYDIGISSSTLRWSVERSKIAIKSSKNGDGLAASAQLGGRVTLSSLELLDVGINIAVAMAPKFQASWKIDPHITSSIELPRLEIGGVSVRGYLRPWLRRKVGRETRRLSDYIAALDLRANIVEKRWNQMCGNFPLGSNSGLWLQIRPQSIRVAQPIFGKGNIYLRFGIDAFTEIVSEEIPPSCPFLKLLTIDPIQSGQIKIALSSQIAYAALSEAISRLAHENNENVAKNGISIAIDQVILHPHGDYLLVETRISGRPKKWFSTRVAGSLYVRAKPHLDVSTQTIGLSQLEIDVVSRNTLLGVLGELAEPIILRLLKGTIPIDMNRPLGRLRNQAESVLLALSSEDITVEGKLKKIGLTELSVGSDYLNVVAIMEGEVSARVESIALD